MFRDMGREGNVEELDTCANWRGPGWRVWRMARIITGSSWIDQAALRAEEEDAVYWRQIPPYPCTERA